MPKITWDGVGEKKYELGVDHGILSVVTGTTYGDVVAWNGLTGVTESPSGAESNKSYADNIEYANILSAEEFGATIECYTYPDEFKACDGNQEIVEGVTIGQQNRAKFGFGYRTKVGNDTEGQEHGYQLHLVYGAQASPSERSRSTINDSPELMQLSFEISTTPVPVTGFRPTAHIILDSTIIKAADMKKIEDALYGTDGTGDSDTGTKGKFLMPDEIAALLNASSVAG